MVVIVQYSLMTLAPSSMFSITVVAIQLFMRVKIGDWLSGMDMVQFNFPNHHWAQNSLLSFD